MLESRLANQNVPNFRVHSSWIETWNALSCMNSDLSRLLADLTKEPVYASYRRQHQESVEPDAKALGSRLRIVHVVDELIIDYSGVGGINFCSGDIIEGLHEAGKKLLADADALVRRSGLEPESVLPEAIGGPSARLIVAQANEWQADLIVMGTDGRRGIRRLALGSDAERCCVRRRFRC